MGAFFARLARRARDLAALATWNLAVEVVGRKSNVPPVALLRREPRFAHDALRQQAIYLAVVAGVGHPRRSIARAIGMSVEAVARHCRVVEQMRENPRIDRHLDELELEMMP